MKPTVLLYLLNPLPYDEVVSVAASSCAVRTRCDLCSIGKCYVFRYFAGERRAIFQDFWDFVVANAPMTTRFRTPAMLANKNDSV